MKLERTIVHVPSTEPDYWWKNLYILSDEDAIESETPRYMMEVEGIHKGFIQSRKAPPIAGVWKYIIGTTDSDIQELMQDDKGKLHLNIPSISEDITTAYAASPFDKVMVEYEDYEECHNYNGKHLNKDCSCKGGDFRRPVKLCNDRTLLSVSLVEEEKMIPMSEVNKLVHRAIKHARLPMKMLTEEQIDLWIKANVK